MKKIYSLGFVLMVLFVTTMSVAALESVSSNPNPEVAVSCHKINAKGIGQDLGNGMTQANILEGGLLQGTTKGNFVITGLARTVASLEGTVEFTTNRGTLTVTVTGTLDTATGEFSAFGPVTDATGKLAGATGTLNLKGVEDLSNGSFVEDVTGRICVDLAPNTGHY
jgi:hypothetical protein